LLKQFGSRNLAGCAAIERLEPRMLLSGTAAASAVPVLTDLVDFSATDPFVAQSPNSGLLQDAAGDLFGTTSSGQNTTPQVYEVVHGTSSLKVLASFPTSMGTNVSDLAIDSSGNLFGVAQLSDNFTDTVWTLPAGSNTLASLASLTGAVGHGFVLNQTTGDLYGTVGSSLFQVPTTGGTFDFVATFQNAPVLPKVTGNLILDADGNIFGEATSLDGASSDVWEFTNGNLKEVGTTATLSGAASGGIHGGLTLDPATGDIYGTADDADTFDTMWRNTVFVLRHGTTALASVTAVEEPRLTDISVPLAIDNDGNLFGEISVGSQRTNAASPGAVAATPDIIETTNFKGSLVKWTKATNTVATLFNFNYFNGIGAVGGPLISSNAFGSGLQFPYNIYGIAGKLNKNGTIWEYGQPGSAAGPGAPTPFLGDLAAFPTSDILNDQTPAGGIVQDAAGDIFGTTIDGGSDGVGTVFEVPAGVSSAVALASFTSATGRPGSQLALDAAGDLFGMNSDIGDNRGGVWVLLKGTSTILPIATLPKSPAQPDFEMAGLVYDPSSNSLFGVDDGALFELPATGGFTVTLATFADIQSGGSSIGQPQGTIGVDADGNVFGECASALWEFTGGAVTVLASGNFDFQDGVTLDNQGHVFATQATHVVEYFSNGAGLVDVGSFPGLISGPVGIDKDGGCYAIVIGDIQTGYDEELCYLKSGTNNVLAAFSEANGRVQIGLSGIPVGNLLISSTSNGVAPIGNYNIIGIAAGGGPGGGGTVWEYGVPPATAQPLAPPVTISVTSNVLPSAAFVVPGDRGLVRLQLNNHDNTPKSGVVKIQLYLSPDDNPLHGVGIGVPSFEHVSVRLAANGTQDLTAAYIAPAGRPGTVHLLVMMTPVTGLTAVDVDTQPAVDPAALSVTYQFGTVDRRRGVRLNALLDGFVVNCVMIGSGTGTFQLDDRNGFTLALSGTTAATTVVIIAPNGAPFDGVSDNNPLGAIIAPLVDVDAGTIRLAGARAIRLQHIIDTSLISTAPIGALLISAWTRANPNPPRSVSAPSIGVLLDRGDFAGNLAVSGSISTMIVGENLSGDILAGTTFGPDGEPGGGDDTFAAGRIGTLVVRGEVDRSIIAAGLSVSDDVFPLDGNQSLLPGSRIGALMIGGALSPDSRVISSSIPRRVRIGSRLVNTLASDPRFVS
jgi:hypothetical protein